MTRWGGAALAAALWVSAAPALAGEGLPPAAQAVDLDEQLGRTLSGDLAFTDEEGQRVTLGERFRGERPIVLVLAYYRCPMLCGLVLRGVVKGLTGLDYQLGADYQALTVSIDPRDTPAAASDKRQSTLAGLGRRAATAAASGGWPFLVGDAPTIARLADEVGFRYAYDPRTDQYAHPAAAIILTPAGKVSRYLYGVDFSPRDLRLALLEAGEGKTGTIVERVLVTCYRYDPAARAYGPFILGFMRLGGALILVVVASTLAVLFHRERQRDAGGAP